MGPQPSLAEEGTNLRVGASVGGERDPLLDAAVLSSLLIPSLILAHSTGVCLFSNASPLGGRVSLAHGVCDSGSDFG